MDLITIVGVVGAACTLIAFMGNEWHLLHPRSRVYDLLNLSAGVLLIVYGVVLQSWPFVVINLVWALVALRYLVRRRAA